MSELAALLSSLADEQATADPQAVEQHDLGGTVEYLREGKPFAVASDA